MDYKISNKNIKQWHKICLNKNYKRENDYASLSNGRIQLLMWSVDCLTVKFNYKYFYDISKVFKMNDINVENL